MLAPGGVLVISTPNKTRLGAKVFKVKNQVGEHGHGHEREYGLDEIVRLIKKTELNVVSARTISFYAGVGREVDNRYYYPLINFMNQERKVRNFVKILMYPFLKLMPQFRDSLLIIAKKT